MLFATLFFLATRIPEDDAETWKTLFANAAALKVQRALWLQ